MKRIISFFTRLSEEYLPDAFVFCLILTLIVFASAWAFTPNSFLDVVSFWDRDFWGLNAFAMQMVFVLITGHMLATTPLIKKILTSLVSLVPNETMGLIVLSLFSVIACWINWGFGLIVSGVLAIELAKKLGRVNFGLFISAAYAGFLVWHAGLSGSIPLKIAGQDEILGKVYPGLSIPLSETIFSSMNLTIVFILLFLLPIIALWMRTDQQVLITHEDEAELTLSESELFRDKLEKSRLLIAIFFIIFLGVIFLFFRHDLSLDINRVNFIFLFLALILHGSSRAFLNALKNSIGSAGGIVIQFPFYAGIMGMMQHSGLADSISQFFTSIASAQTLPVLSFLAGGLVNFFVPSGGGQWVVQGPIMLKAALELGVPPAKVSMAIAWGDAWTNMIQPFWLLPLLGLAKLQLKDVMGYCLIYLLVSGLVISSVLYFF